MSSSLSSSLYAIIIIIDTVDAYMYTELDNQSTAYAQQMDIVIPGS